MLGFRPPLGGANAAMNAGLLPSARRVSGSFYKAMKLSGDGMFLAAPFIGLEVASAEPGDRLATGAASTAGLFTYPVLAGMIAAGLAMTGVGTPAAAWIALVLAAFPNSKVEDGIHRGIRSFTDWGRQVRRLEMGGRYQDTEQARAQRYQAISAMSATMQNSRRYLGQEALLLHQ